MPKSKRTGKATNYSDAVFAKNKKRKQTTHENRLAYFAKRLEKRIATLSESEKKIVNDAMTRNKRSAVKLVNKFLKK